MDSEEDAVKTRGLTDLTHETKDQLQDLNLQMARFEGILQEVQTSITSQSVLLQDLHSQIFKGSLNQSPAISLAVASAPMSSRSILKKQVRTEDEAEMIPLPMEMPQNLPILPGEVKLTRLTCCLEPWKAPFLRFTSKNRLKEEYFQDEATNHTKVSQFYLSFSGIEWIELCTFFYFFVGFFGSPTKKNMQFSLVSQVQKHQFPKLEGHGGIEGHFSDPRRGTLHPGRSMLQPWMNCLPSWPGSSYKPTVVVTSTVHIARVQLLKMKKHLLT